MRRLSTVVVCLLLVTAGCVGVGPGASVEDGQSTAGEPGIWTVTVVEVVDGDTLDVRYRNGSTETVRLLGVDTPEVHVETSPSEFEGVPDSEAGRQWLSDWGDEASAFVTDRLVGETVTIRTDPEADRRGSYGRLLAYVSHDGTDVNQLLLERGLARLYESEFTRLEEYRRAEAAAMEGNVGVWGYERTESSRSRRSNPATVSFLLS